MRFLSMISLSLSLLVAVILSIVIPAQGKIRNKDDNPTGRSIQIINKSDVKVDVFWVHPNTRELVKSVDTGILKGTDTQINSYIGHKFQIQELRRKTTGLCMGEDGECRTAEFVVTSNEDQQFTIEKDLTISYSDSKTIAMEKAKEVSKECPMPELSESGEIADMDSWAQCLQEKINATLDDSRQEIEFQAGVRKSLGRKLVNYACNDEKYPPSYGSYNETLDLRLGRNQNPKMQYMFQSENSKIVYIENFVARSQCKWLKEKAAKGGANKIMWDATNDVTIQTVVDRIYKAIGQVLEFSDKDFFKRQELSDQALFEMHVSDAGGSSGQFVAEDHDQHPLLGSILLFCEVPEKGGAVHFPKTGIHVKPEVGSALLVSYLDPNTREKHDDAFTSEHVECPVVEGTQVTLKYHIAYDK